MTTPPLVDAARLDDPAVQVIDGSWHLPIQGRDARAEHRAQRIPGAVHLDIDVVAARIPGPPNRMLPPPDVFAEEVGRLGIRPDAHLVVYDTLGLYSAARVWWMFTVYGHERVSVLDGGLPAWIKAGGPLESGAAPAMPPTRWSVGPPLPKVRDWRQVLANIDSQAEQLVDVRPAAMFNGSTAAQYPGVRDGHIPGAVNLSQRDLLHPDATFRTDAEIRALLAARGVELGRPIIATCGSGVTACILALALATIGEETCAIYDGSWEEWGTRRDLPSELRP